MSVVCNCLVCNLKTHWSVYKLWEAHIQASESSIDPFLDVWFDEDTPWIGKQGGGGLGDGPGLGSTSPHVRSIPRPLFDKQAWPIKWDTGARGKDCIDGGSML
jgi:hypothetical protein